ncbi:hypothetical protein BDV98DRAFT_658687 [Pterulicium gracile]|uniref:Uncharacterized protein n=1 Tax=Pterulicium gracile TaxID=1884261 RepID=A0A5C3Q860_9AGAR|nr:hypothetical protein BDV98DRAFT_658687 [Pterula gracilis]
MPITFKVANHPARSVISGKIWQTTTWGTRGVCKEFLQSTFSGTHTVDFSKITPEDNGFVRTVIKAYNEHHRLALRRDDVWISILSQFNLYINAHAEELRHQFVTHEGQTLLTVVANGIRCTADFGKLAKQMMELVGENVVDTDLRDWILPNFLTTTDNDTVVASVLIMGTPKAYFQYQMMLGCGLPSVPLKGK